ncbi:MAG: AraC family transcriptional regulator, regulatory protein of adaptative response [Verrucomicrobia bacterium]|jgi:AraC family transcriptional regulator of adaptative response/methylated-DNA-[protein]-cysteine methyltransferase|nr:MAG: AraC family transcriptional regulator, regulatory protein of adaptative response [Verrucomicrobiota bacterium]
MKRKETLRFAIGRGSDWLGWVLVAWSEVGLCAILFGDDAWSLQKDLERRFRGLECVPVPEDDRLGQVLTFLEVPERGLDLPLDLRGTPFQLRVWEALRALPFGTTTSYGKLAAQLGMPFGARAVAAACAANPLAGVVPCHRVIGRNGKLTGYRWGTGRKAAFLARESGVWFQCL